MPTNVEIKARLLDKERALRVARELSGGEGTLLVQEDTFYTADKGRLKLRVQSDRDSAQLISYHRSDVSGPKLSDFHTADVQDVTGMKAVLTHALGIVGCVRKRRLLFLVGQTRIHIDEVEGLGDHLELEVLLKEGQTLSEGEGVARELMEKLGIAESCLIQGAYMDLLLQQQQKAQTPH